MTTRQSTGIGVFSVAAGIFVVAAIFVAVIPKTAGPTIQRQAERAEAARAPVATSPTKAKPAERRDPKLELERAELEHAVQLDRLKLILLEAIDSEIRRTGNKYLVSERRALVENGVTPLAPVMQPAVRAYLDGVRLADERLRKARKN